MGSRHSRFDRDRFCPVIRSALRSEIVQMGGRKGQVGSGRCLGTVGLGSGRWLVVVLDQHEGVVLDEGCKVLQQAVSVEPPKRPLGEFL